VSWVSIRDVTQPSPAQPDPVWPARPWRPYSPLRAPPSPDPFGSFDFSRAVTSLSFFHLSLSPYGALGFGVEITRIRIPGGEFSPSPSLLSLSPSLSLLLPLLARAPHPSARAALGSRAHAAPPRCPSARVLVPSHGRARAAPASPRPALAPPRRAPPSPAPGEPCPAAPFPGEPRPPGEPSPFPPASDLGPGEPCRTAPPGGLPAPGEPSPAPRPWPPARARRRRLGPVPARASPPVSAARPLPARPRPAEPAPS
jgi:hypothetical protein